MERKTDGWMVEQKKWMDGWNERRMDGWMERKTDGPMDGWMEQKINGWLMDGSNKR